MTSPPYLRTPDDRLASLPMEAPARYRGLLVMNTMLATAEQPQPQGFVDWRAMCRAMSGPDHFVVGRVYRRPCR